MPNLRRWPVWISSLPELLARAVGVTWGLVMALLLIVAVRDHHPEFSSRLECGTDPQDFLRAGEMLDQVSLRIIVDAHCTNPRYLSDERIALRYGGAEVEIGMRKLTIGGETYYSIVSVGDP